MTRGDRFARRVFLAAGIYGILVLLPQYFLEARIGRDDPPPSRIPSTSTGSSASPSPGSWSFSSSRGTCSANRLLMLPAILEKLSFGLAAFALYFAGRTGGTIVVAGSLDLVLAVLFAMAFRGTRGPRH